MEFRGVAISGKNVGKYGFQILFEQRRVFTHREVTDMLHFNERRVCDLLGSLLAHGGMTGAVVFSRHEIDRRRVLHLTDNFPTIVVDAVIVDVALEYAGSAGCIEPPDLPAFVVGALWRD